MWLSDDPFWNILNWKESKNNAFNVLPQHALTTGKQVCCIVVFCSYSSFTKQIWVVYPPSWRHNAYAERLLSGCCSVGTVETSRNESLLLNSCIVGVTFQVGNFAPQLKGIMVSFANVIKLHNSVWCCADVSDWICLDICADVITFPPLSSKSRSRTTIVGNQSGIRSTPTQR